MNYLISYLSQTSIYFDVIRKINSIVYKEDSAKSKLFDIRVLLLDAQEDLSEANTAFLERHIFQTKEVTDTAKVEENILLGFHFKHYLN